MATDIPFFKKITRQLQSSGARLVAVSKTKPPEDIRALYDAGQRDFGENYVQELLRKQPLLPPDIRWHFIGHLQRNKVKYLASFVHMIQSVDNLRLLREINNQAEKESRVVDVLLQVHLGAEETKFGMDEKGLNALLQEVTADPGLFGHVRLCGLMGMATNTDDEKIIRGEFRYLKRLSETIRERYPSELTAFSEISMGMSSDYNMALEQGSTMIRIGSLLFGRR